MLFIETLFALFPAAQFIQLVRDPRDVYCSVRAKAASATPHWATETPEITATEWCRRIRCGVPWRDRPDRYIEVRYEALVAQPEATLRAVLAFLGEPWSPGILEGGTIFTTSVGRWRAELSTAEIGAIEAVAGDTMSHMGYSLAAAVGVV
jgi:hypothetical protein